jgi:hypothetical protein
VLSVPATPELPPPAKAVPPAKPKAVRKQAPDGTSKTAQLIQLALSKHNLAGTPLDQVSALATRLAAEVDLHPATARRTLLAHARQLQGGGRK